MTIIQKILTLSLAAALCASCAKSDFGKSPVEFRKDYIGAIEKAHSKSVWDAQDSIQMTINVTFNGSTRIDGTMTMETDFSQIRIDQNNGDTLVWDGNRAWISPADSEMKGARFHVLTWPYFLAAPFKLSDPGTLIAAAGESVIYNDEYPETAKLTFDNGVGDAPKDWYVLYKNPNSDVLDAMAYIVTYFSGDAEEGEKEPHAVIYRDYKSVDGVPIPHNWDFTYYTHEDGVHGDIYGAVKITDAKFVTPDPGFYSKPEGAREDKLPGS